MGASEMERVSDVFNQYGVCGRFGGYKARGMEFTLAYYGASRRTVLVSYRLASRSLILRESSLENLPLVYW